MSPDAPFLGRGWAFPPSFGRGGSEIETVAGAADVAESLHIIFTTETGERRMREDFGASLSRHVFAQVDRGVLTDMRSAILAAVIAWEPRIEVAGLEIVESGDEPGLLTISLSYVLRGANSRYNFVYPFYIREASGSARP
jgi:uncharacterized protein